MYLLYRSSRAVRWLGGPWQSAPKKAYIPKATLKRWIAPHIDDWEDMRAKASARPAENWLQRDLYELALELKADLDEGQVKEIAGQIEGEYRLVLSSGMPLGHSIVL